MSNIFYSNSSSKYWDSFYCVFLLCLSSFWLFRTKDFYGFVDWNYFISRLKVSFGVVLICLLLGFYVLLDFRLRKLNFLIFYAFLFD